MFCYDVDLGENENRCKEYPFWINMSITLGKP